MQEETKSEIFDRNERMYEILTFLNRFHYYDLLLKGEKLTSVVVLQSDCVERKFLFYEGTWYSKIFRELKQQQLQ